MSEKKKILMIDDEQEICDLIKSVLERTGRFEVLVSTRAKEGIQLAKSNMPDLILLDVMMPDMDGTEAARLLCEDEQTKAITIVFVTAIAIPMAFMAALVQNEELKQKAGPVGGHYFIQKPISPKDLIQRLDEILSSVPKKN
jgi:two-component system, OmpR family, alkaline phosphatase synthesis response regulator PhoP